MSNDELLKLNEELQARYATKRKIMGDAWLEMLDLGKQYKEIEAVLKKRGVIDG
ncbi:MAG: hypothetical protein LUD72_00045 [Bacteroidales bacterium]|nr:hypothetical protein [Bacteroidales bacterium]